MLHQIPSSVPVVPIWLQLLSPKVPPVCPRHLWESSLQYTNSIVSSDIQVSMSSHAYYVMMSFDTLVIMSFNTLVIMSSDSHHLVHTSSCHLIHLSSCHLIHVIWCTCLRAHQLSWFLRNWSELCNHQPLSWGTLMVTKQHELVQYA